MSFIDDLEKGLVHLQQGRIEEARQCFDHVLAEDSEQPDALHLMGICDGQSGRFAEAEIWINRAISCLPDNPGFRTSLAEVLMQSGKLNEARQAFEVALDYQPDHVPAVYGLGLALHEMEDIEAAEKAYRLALNLQPDLSPALFNLGVILEGQDDLEGARGYYRQATRVAPGYHMAWLNLGRVNEILGNYDDARHDYELVVRMDPDNADAWFGLAVCMQKTGAKQEAMEAWLRALDLRPGHPKSLANFSGLLREMGHLDQAERAARQALEGDAGSATAWSNLGSTLHCLGRYDQAEEAFRNALKISPDHVEAHVSLGQTLLLTERLHDGWEHYNWRLMRHESWLGKSTPAPVWQGQDIPGQSLLVYGEQGLGDCLQFLRFVPRLKGHADRIILQLPGPLKRLIKDQVDCDVLIGSEETPPDHDFRIPLMSLPMMLGLEKADLTMQVPYITAPQSEVPADTGHDSMKVGLIWAGNPEHQNDRNRSIPLDWLDQLLNIPGATFVSLQKGAAEKDVETGGMQERLLPLGHSLRDFADTAAAIDRLDLVISVDTAPAHLAGAMGKEIWLLLPQVPDWRWGVYGQDSYWYPQMTLFRQARPGDWAGVVAALKDKLQTRIAQRDTDRH